MLDRVWQSCDEYPIRDVIPLQGSPIKTPMGIWTHQHLDSSSPTGLLVCDGELHWHKTPAVSW